MVQGIVITFWSRLLGGTTLAQLHRDWAFGLHVWKALAAGRHFNVLAIACIRATLVVTDGPLLQRASSMHSEIPKESVVLSVAFTHEIPSYWIGFTTYDLGRKVGAFDAEMEFFPVLKGFLSQEPMKNSIVGCRGKCSATVRAPALAVDHCSSKVVF